MGNWPPHILTPVHPQLIANGDGDFAIEFAENFGTIGKDGVSGRTGDHLVLRDWQKELVRHVYARDENGGLQHQVALIGLPRKNGKSALSSVAFALYSLILEGIDGGEVYSVASEKEQARIVFGEAKRMVENSELSNLVQVYRDAIFVPSTNSVYRVLSSESLSKEGLNPSRTIIDELHAHKTRDIFDVFQLAMGNRGKLGQLIGITTAGVKAYDGRDSIAYELYQYGKKIQNGEVSDPNFFMAWWEAPAESDHTDPEVWRQANPGFDDLVSAEDFASAVKRTPEAEFRTKRLNQWVNSQTAWLPGGAWDACKRDIEWDGDAEYILGFDGSFSGDSTALVACTIPKEDEQPRIFLVAAWEKDYGVDDDSWRVPIAEVEQTIRDFIQANPYCREIACDPFRWQRSMEALMNEGLPIVEYNTGSLARMIPATAKFYDAVAEQRIEHDGNPVIARHLDNCVLKVDARGPRVTKAKDGSKRKIDAAISTLIAFDRATVGRIELGAPEFFI